MPESLTPASSSVVVYLIVVVGARFPLVRQWTMWAGVACALGALGQVVRFLATPDVAVGIAIIVSVAWAWAFLAEARAMIEDGVLELEGED